MQKSPNVAALEVIVNATHHHRGAGCSTTPEMRSVSQLKLRRFKTSGTRVISRSASFTVSDAAGAASIFKLPIATIEDQNVKIENSSFRKCLYQTRDSDIFRVRHFGVRIANPREIARSRNDVQIVQDSVIAVLFFHF